MKQYGFLQTSSPVGKSKKSDITLHNPLESVRAIHQKQNLELPQDPLQNFQITFMGPKNSTIKERVSGTSLMEHELWEILFTRNEYGWRTLHFAVLDYFCEKYKLTLTLVHHEYKLMDELASSEFHFYQSILHGNWGPKNPTR